MLLVGISGAQIQGRAPNLGHEVQGSVEGRQVGQKSTMQEGQDEEKGQG